MGGVAGGLLTGLIGAAPGIGEVIGGIDLLVQAFLQISGGCGQACVAAAELQQVGDVAGVDVLAVVRMGYMDGTDGAAILIALENQVESSLAQLVQNGDQHGNAAIAEIQNNYSGLIAVSKTFGKASNPLSIASIEPLLINPTTQGWYPASVVAGNNLAIQIVQAYITGGQTAAASTDLSGTLDTVLSNIDNTLAQAQNAQGSVLGDILGGISGIVGGAAKVGTSTNNKLLASILGVFGVSAQTSNDIQNKIVGVADSINKVIQTINTDVIGKVIEPVLTGVQQTLSLSTTIEGDLKSGIAGILQIPGQIADTLSSQANAVKQGAILGNEGRQTTASEILVPGIGQHIGSKLSEATASLSMLTGLSPEQLNQISPLNLSEPPGLDEWKSKIAGWFDELNKSSGIAGYVLHLLYRVLMLVESTVASAEPMLREAEQIANTNLPVTTLDLATLVTALIRGETSLASAQTEALRQGVSTDRLQLLTNVAMRLVDAGDAITANYRGVLSDADFETELSKQGWTAERIQTLKQVRAFLADPATASDWFARGFISPAQFQGILTMQGWSGDDIAIFEQALFRPRDLGDVARYYSRAQAAKQGFLAESLTQLPPTDVSDAARSNRMSPDFAGLAWLAHWKDLDPFLWLQAYYRSLITKEYLGEALASQNYPPEVTDVFIEGNRPLISFFYVVEMFAAGVFTLDEGTAYLQRYGFDDAAIQAILKFGQFKSLGKATEQNTSLAQLSLANLKSMFDAGIIGKTEFVLGIQEHGYNSETAVLLADLYETQDQLKARTANITALVNEVAAGMITEQAALDNLGGQGYTQGEIAKAVLDIRKASAVKAKLPTEAQLIKMAKDTVIDYPTFTATMALLGYHEPWITRIALVEGVPGAGS